MESEGSSLTVEDAVVLCVSDVANDDKSRINMNLVRAAHKAINKSNRERDVGTNVGKVNEFAYQLTIECGVVSWRNCGS